MRNETPEARSAHRPALIRASLMAVPALAALLTMSISVAAPTISSISGDATNGGKITISGSGFGTKARPDALVWDTVDNSYGSAVNNATVTTGRSSVFIENSNTSPVRFAKSSSLSRTPFSTLQYHGSGNSWLAHPVGAGGDNPPQSQRKLYIGWWVRFATGPYENVNNASHKFIRVWAGGDNDLRISWTQRQLTVQNSNAGGSSAISSWAGDVWGTPGRWHLHEMWIDADAGVIKTWVDGKIVHDFQSNDTRYLKRTHPTGLNISLIGWNPSHGVTGGTNSFEMDDFVVDNTLARVVLSNSERWSDSAAQVREYQPATSWSSNQITISANPGQLSESEPMYLYVIAPDGSVNSTGFPVKDSGPRPEPPTSVSVQ